MYKLLVQTTHSKASEQNIKEHNMLASKITSAQVNLTLFEHTCLGKERYFDVRPMLKDWYHEFLQAIFL